jgi:hypothetical protein
MGAIAIYLDGAGADLVAVALDDGAQRLGARFDLTHTAQRMTSTVLFMFRSFQTRASLALLLATRPASRLKPRSTCQSRDNRSFPDVFEACEPGQCGIERSISVDLW